MSSVKDNPYFVEAQFQSDAWSNLSKVKEYFSRRHKSKAAVEIESRIPSVQPARKDLDKLRASNIVEFLQLMRVKQHWTDDFANAKMGLYECLYMKNAKLYQGSSLFHDIATDENKPPSKIANSVICLMHECGTTTRSYQMKVPKKSNPLTKEFVLWRITPYDLRNK